jgi:hypothetical protein
MELDSNQENLHIHEGLLHQMLENLETAHHVFMIRESLDINREPEKSCMSEFEGKFSRALIKQKVQLQFAERNPEQDQGSGISQEDAEQYRKFLIRTKARGHKINQQRKIKAKATAVSNVISHMDKSNGQSRRSLLPDRKVETRVPINARRSFRHNEW